MEKFEESGILHLFQVPILLWSHVKAGWKMSPMLENMSLSALLSPEDSKD